VLTSDERGQVTAIMRQLEQRHAAIDADPSLSPHGKRARHAREQLAAEAAHKSIIDASDARYARDLRDRYHQAFGLKAAGAGDVLADRDARGFAAKIDNPADALRELTSADLRGDTSLATAIAERAWSQRGRTDLGGAWEKVVRAYADASPARNRHLGALAELEGSSAAKFTDNLYRHLPRPADLQQWGTLESVAAQADSPASGVT
jgi:hypothetical protein